MHYTDNPLMDNFAKLLVNYDLNDTGSILSPRPGLRTEAAYKQIIRGSEDALTNEHIVDLKRIYKNSKPYTSVILGSGGTKPTKHPDVLTGSAYGVVLDEESVEPASSIDPADETSPSYKGYRACKLTGSPHYLNLSNAKIHNMDLHTELTNPKIIGTYAWNNDYYYFTDSPEGTPQLCKASFNEDTKYLESTKIEPKMLEPTQTTLGYNMLLENPYDFACAYSDAMGETINLTGLLPYTNEDSPHLYLKPRPGDTIKFHLFYAVKKQGTGTKYKFVFEWAEPTSGTWNSFLESVEILGATESPEPVKALLQGVSSSLVHIRATVYKYVGDTVREYPEAVINYTLDTTESTNIAQFSDDLPNYNLMYSKGLCYWADRLVCYGCPEDPSMLFVSDLNDPTYFPYPNNIDTFDEPIMYVTPYLKNNLLVFTKTQLYMLTLTADYLSWTQTLIQSNLDITEWDLHSVQIVKNMVLFKSGNYYYMVVPKAASSTGLTIAPISRNMEKFFDNFEQNIKSLFKEMYNYIDSLQLAHYYNYLDYESIHNVYLFKTTQDVLVNVDLIYNSNKRYWRIYIYESSGVLTPFIDNATDRGSLISMAQATQGLIFQVQSYSNDSLQKKDKYLSQGESYESAQIFKNYQYINTGYREISSNLKKRFRELQFELDNTSQTALKFYINFYIDGDPRRYCYATAHEDVVQTYYNDTDEKHYVVFSQPIDEATTNELPSMINLDAWTLNESAFPESYFWKIRVPVSGKGYTPQMQIISQNENAYDLLNISWVYRMMYTR